MSVAAPGIALDIDHVLASVTIDIRNVPGNGVALFLSRTGPSGILAYVRGCNPLEVTPGDDSVLVRDYEAPLGVPLIYVAVIANASGVMSPAATAEITLPFAACEDTWLTDIAAPSNSLRVIIERLDELAYEAASAAHYVLNRRTPIVTSDIARAPTLELAVITTTHRQRDRVRAALGNGVPVLLRTAPMYGLGSMYLMATGWKEQRIVNRASEDDRRFVVAMVQVERPDPIFGIAKVLASYADIAATYGTYADLKASRDTYDDVLHDPTAAGATDLVPWPPEDV